MGFKRFIATINFVLPLCGYQLVTTMFSSVMSAEGASRLVTVPYRAFALGVSICTFIIALKEPFRLAFGQKCLWGIWLIAAICLIMNFGVLGKPASSEYLTTQYLFLFIITGFTAFTITKSFRYIDAKLAITLILIGTGVCSCMIISQNNVLMDEENLTRLSGNVALNPIGTGHLGLTTFLFSLFFIFRINRLNKIFRFVIGFLAIIGFIVWMRAGSRGPILASIIISFFFFISRSSNKLKSIFFLFLFFIGLYLCLDLIKDFIEDFSPILYKRLFEREDQLSDRSPLYLAAWNAFADSPLWGGTYALPLIAGKTYIYPHNFVLDALMQGGVIGGVLVCNLIYTICKNAMTAMRENGPIFILSIYMIQSISANIITGTLYMNIEFFTLYTFVSLYLIRNKFSK